MTEKKLRLAVPYKGWLVKQGRWTSKDVLERAGIGEYYKEGKDVHFRSTDPDIEVIPVRPADIPFFLLRSIFDLGVTGWDLAEEAMLTSPIKDLGLTGLLTRIDFKLNSLPLDEICNMGCGYVDLAFLTTKNRSRKDLNSQDRLKLFLDENSESGRGMNCITRYPNLAARYLSQLGYLGEIISVRGTSESYVSKGIGDFIFETIATGESLKDYDLEVLGIAGNSTTRLFARPANKVMITKRKQEKIQEVKGRIEDVLRDIDEYCQVRFSIDIPADFIDGRLFYEFERELYNRIGKYDNLNLKQANHNFEIEVIAKKKKLPMLINLLNQSHTEGFRVETKTRSGISYLQFKWNISKASAINLKSLFLYCPVTPFDSYVEIFGDATPLPMDHFIGKYPVCDSSALRQEHRQQATIFTFENGQFQVNPQYSHLFTAS